MTIQSVEPVAEHLFQYMVASGDMYFAETEQRDILVSRDQHGHMQIWGQDASGDPCTRVTLCQVLLEYGMYCCASRNQVEARGLMQEFGRELGYQTAAYLKANAHLLKSGHRAVRALEQIFGTLGARSSTEYSGHTARLVVRDCPVENTAKCCGLTDVELAHDGMQALCKAVVADLSPETVVGMPSEIGPEFVISLAPV